MTDSPVKTPDQCDNQFFKTLVESLTSEMFVCDAEGTIIYLNPASEYLIGHKKEHILGKNIHELVDDGTISASVTLEVLKSQKITTIVQGVKNNRNLLAIGTPIYDQDNKLRYVLTAAQDIQELFAINNTLIAKNEELLRQMEAMETYKDAFFADEGLIFVGDAMDEIINTVYKVAPLDVIILLLGETGTGKEGLAKLIHRVGKKESAPFVKINCGLIPEHLFESELFGYEEGAFTGANKGGKRGKVELANGGTLFLDEIGELPLSMQVKLLEFIQEQTFVRVGGVEPIVASTRIVAATHRDLKAMCEEGLFRWDLYFRLNVMPLTIPALREQLGEIIHLAQFMLYKCNKKYKLNKVFDKDIAAVLLSYEWPGNLRELENIIERLYISSKSNVLDANALQALLGKAKAEQESKVFCSDIMPLKEAKAAVERQLIERAYEQFGSSYKVAEALNIDQSTVIKLKKKHGMNL